VKPLYKILN